MIKLVTSGEGRGVYDGVRALRSFEVCFRKQAILSGIIRFRGLWCKGRKIFFLEMRFIRSSGPPKCVYARPLKGGAFLKKYFGNIIEGLRQETRVTKELRLY